MLEDATGSILLSGTCKEDQGPEVGFDKLHLVELGLGKFTASCCECDGRLMSEEESTLLTRDIRAVNVLMLDFELRHARRLCSLGLSGRTIPGDASPSRVNFGVTS